MKKLVSLIAVLALLVTCIVPFSLAEDTAAEEPAAEAPVEIHGPSEYVEPTYYQNGEGEPTIGVTLVGVLEVDGKYFKDSDNDKELDPFEDWRLSVEERAADLVPKMTIEQRLGLLANQLACSPNVTKGADAYNEDGTVNFGALINITPDAFNAKVVNQESAALEGGFTGGAAMLSTLSGTRANSTGEMISYENRSGVVRATTDVESGALWNNATNMVAEYAAVEKGEPAIPFYIISNPQTIVSAPAVQGQAAAVIGATPEEDDFSLIERYAELDRELWYARGIDGMYGPQIDLITDPRWPRDNTTYTELPEVMAGIATALVNGYKDGQGAGSVSLTVKHFPGDSASLNGFESHNKYGEWRVYGTEGSLEKYFLPAFQAAIDAGVTGIMPCYSRPNATLSAPQSYRGTEIEFEEIATAYNKGMLQTLLHDLMGFKGYVNTDSGIVEMGMTFGAEDKTVPERIAMVINAGSDIVGDWFSGINYEAIYEAYDQGLIEPEAFDRATTNRVSIMIAQGEFENPYRDPKAGAELEAELQAGPIAELGEELHHKSVVLMKNHDSVLPLTDTSKKIYIQSFTANGEDDAAVESFAAAFTAAGFTVVEDEEEADIAFLDVVPGGIAQGVRYMNTLDLVDGLDAEDYDPTKPITEAKTGEETEIVTLQDVKKIAKVADAVHANGGIVIASINISNPWILTNLEPYCDGLIGSFSTSVQARVDVLTGAYNPTGRLPVTMVSCNEVIATVEQEIDGQVYDICVSPNDVPGYDKDQYIAADVLAQSPSGSYAYKDADGNIYAARFGLSY